MKKVMLLIMLSGLSHEANLQAQGGVEQYYYMGERRALTFIPIAYYQTSSNWYIEGRYNFEALKTFSVYAGKTFEKEAALSYSASPVAGVVMGRFNGGSVGGNLEVDYKRFFFSSQLQYTFSMEDKTENFIYSWSDLSYQVLNNISGGFSVQQTNLYAVKYKLEKGIFLKALLGNWSFPLYVFSPFTKERYFVLGLNLDW